MRAKNLVGSRWASRIVAGLGVASAATVAYAAQTFPCIKYNGSGTACAIYEECTGNPLDPTPGGDVIASSGVCPGNMRAVCSFTIDDDGNIVPTAGCVVVP